MDIRQTSSTQTGGAPDYAQISAADLLKGGQLPKEPLLGTYPPFPGESLTSLTIARLRSRFHDHNHHPSEKMWEALSAVAGTMEKMANRSCDPAIYLSSLDPGVGKTATVVEFIRALLTSASHRDVAVLVCVARKEQIQSIVREAGLDRESFAVFTADSALNGLGSSNKNHSRVLFTTHSMIEARSAGRSFVHVEEFHYLDEVRAVRVWDEAILPGQTVTLSRDDLGLLLKPLRGSHPGLASAIDDLFVRVGGMDDRSTIYIPDLATQDGLGLHEALRLIGDGRVDQVMAAEALWILFGKTVTIRRDGKYGNTMLDYRDTLPKDIMPLLVLDASVRVRATYQLWKERRGHVVTLPTAAKSYENHTIHLWDRGGGKSAFRDHINVLAGGVAAAILSKPDEQWLVVHHLTEAGFDVEARVRSLISTNSKVHFLHWGVHDATNLFSDVPNVILAGTLFYRPSYYEALGRLASGLPSDAGALSPEDAEQVSLGEHRHLILQALCRGAVRRCVNGGCPRTDTYIIASSRTGIARSLPEIFPGAQIVSWKPIDRPLSGKIAEAEAYVVERLEVEPTTIVAFGDVMRFIGWRCRREFKRSIRRHEDFVDALAAKGIEEWGVGRYPRGFRRISGGAA